MLIRRSAPIASSEITSKADYLNRRSFMTGAAAALGVAALAGERVSRLIDPGVAHAAEKLHTVKSPLSVNEAPTSLQDITHYNNFYEFGTGKDDPARNAGALKTRPWTLSISGMVKKPKTADIDSLLKFRPMEERVYRLRCVEGWSMVIPWAGYSLAELIKWSEPLGSAKYVQFLSVSDPKQLGDTGNVGISTPYSEGLRMDEAMHPLTLLTFGLYGETLPNQDGAPVRLIVPWKYGFKSAKSIVSIKFTDQQPPTSWNELAPNEYGFYSNVNPEVDHPRWSQATERRIGAPLFKQRQPTLMFNGYADQVAGLYKGMDLKKYY